MTLILGVALAACEHTTPFEDAAPQQLGPYGTGSLVRLTFDPGEDRDASGRDSVVVYSHLEASRRDGDWCLGFLPRLGGTRLRMACPGAEDPDGRADAWLQASISPDGSRIVYVHQQGRAGSISSETRKIEVAPLEDPGDGRVIVSSGYTLPDGRYANAYRQLQWIDDARLRFLAGTEILVRERDRLTGVYTLDTVFTPLAVTEVTLSDGAMALVPGTDGAVFYAPAGDGLWVAQGAAVRFVPFGSDSASLSVVLPNPALDLAVADGVLIVILRVTLDPEIGLERVLAAVDAATGGLTWMPLPFEPAAVEVIPNTRTLLVEGRAGGGGTDIWRLERP